MYVNVKKTYFDMNSNEILFINFHGKKSMLGCSPT